MSTTYYSKVKIFFTPAARIIEALKSLITARARRWSNSIFSHQGAFVARKGNDKSEQ
jgi:hypothetical protein